MNKIGGLIWLITITFGMVDHSKLCRLIEFADTQTLTNRLAYAYRLPAPLNRLFFNDGMVKVEARKQTLTLTLVDFIAKLTLHIPNRYQNIRRYAGSLPAGRQVLVQYPAQGQAGQAS